MFLNRVPGLASKKLFCAAVFLILASRAVYAAESRGLTIDLSLPAFPVIAGVTQSIEIAMPDGAPDGEFDAEISAGSGWGVLLLPNGPSASGKVSVSKKSPARVEYRWSGASPVNAPVSETIKAEIPELGLSGERGFNVGVDLRIKEIALPSGMKPGIFNEVEIILEDAFNPSLDVAALTERLGVKPEVAMSVSGSSGGGAYAAGDPVVRAFLGGAGTGGGQSYPGKDLTLGSVVSEGGKFIWRSAEGKPSGITPPSSERYTIEAILKSNLGGAPLKNWSSSASGATGNVPVTTDLPGLIGSTVGIISGLDPDAAAEAESSARKFLASGDANGAARALAPSLRKSFGASYITSLGKYASALAASGRGEAEIVGFLEAIVKGFGDAGILLFTRNGVAQWSLSQGAAAYDNARYVAVPFSSGQNITATLTGSSSEDVSLWKIIPAGTNVKKYEKGPWIKEITVFTSEVKPSH